jgi:hypothetical protein
VFPVRTRHIGGINGMKPENAVTKLFNQTILYGGIPLTRRDVYRVMTEQGFDLRTIDLFVFLPDPATTAEIAEWENVSYEERINLAKA